MPLDAMAHSELPQEVQACRRIMTVHRIRLDPTKAQDALFAQCAGIARFSWNWALAEWRRSYAARKEDLSRPAPSEAGLRRALNAIKVEEFPWMLQAPKSVPQQAIKNLGSAFAAFFSGRAKYPKFKAKDQCRESFRPDNGPGTFRVEGMRVKLPRIGWVRMREAFRFGQDLNPVLKSVTISREAGRWFASIAAEIDLRSESRPKAPACGVDLGVMHLLTKSDGTQIAGPKALRRNLSRLARLQRQHARKQKGGKNRAKSRRRIARLHARIRNIRQDALHKITTSLARDQSIVVIENLNVRGMMANRRLSRAISDMGFHEFRRQLTYKLDRSGGRLVVADRFFASSKICHVCGVKAEAMPLSVRTWTCAGCGTSHDRDINAAINLRNLAGSKGIACPVTACGVEGAGAGHEPGVKPSTEKQELDYDKERSSP
jgi:putative transposase